MFDREKWKEFWRWNDWLVLPIGFGMLASFMIGAGYGAQDGYNKKTFDPRQGVELRPVHFVILPYYVFYAIAYFLFYPWWE